MRDDANNVNPDGSPCRAEGTDGALIRRRGSHDAVCHDSGNRFAPVRAVGGRAFRPGNKRCRAARESVLRRPTRALSEPFAAAVQALTEVTKVRIGDTALVSGPGPMGFLCVKLFAAEGIRRISANPNFISS